MSNALIKMLARNIGRVLTDEAARSICAAARELDTLVEAETIERAKQQACGDFVFAIERMEDILEEIKPLHRAHWDETEAHRHALAFNPNYEEVIRHERAGRYVLFTLRKDGRLLGNSAMYMSKSAHTQTLIATEDTLYLLPEARIGRTAMRFVEYVEQVLQEFGTREIDISVKTLNNAGRFLRLLGYRHVENGLNKILETTGEESCVEKKHQNPIH